MDSKVINIAEVGNICLKKSRMARQIHIRLHPERGITVTLPVRCSYGEAEEIVLKKMDWIKKNLVKIRSSEKKKLVFDNNTDFYTRKHQLKLFAISGDKANIQIDKKFINVYYPESLPVEHNFVQRCIRQGVEMAWRVEAQQELPQRVSQLAKQYGFSYARVGIRNSKTRWGSCSGRDSINLSLQMMRLPDHLIDYIILHELCHTVEKNHSPRFYKLLDSIVGSTALLRKELKQYEMF